MPFLDLWGKFYNKLILFIFFKRQKRWGKNSGGNILQGEENWSKMKKAITGTSQR